MIKVAIIGVISAMLALVLKNERYGQGLWVIFAACVLILGMSLTKLESILSVVRTLEDSLGQGTLYLQVLLKMIGIAYIAEFGSELCRDAGFGAVAGQIEFFGKLMLLAVSMPVIQNLIAVIGEIN